MNDRVRIYELARRMNIPNDDIITALRELGYDIKSHSSTVDSNAVGLLIAALGKKKQQEKTKTAKLSSATAGKATTKTQAPSQPAVKPRVLSRYRPQSPIASLESTQDVVAPTQEQIAPSLPVAPASTLSSSQVQPSFTASPQPAQSASSTPGLSHITREQIKQPEHIAVTGLDGKAQHANQERTIPEPAEDESEASYTPTPVYPKEDKGMSAVVSEAKTAEIPVGPVIGDNVEEDKELRSYTPPSQAERAVRPMSPSVPIRIAAPSSRATPPRPPKAHRQLPSERHIQKKEEKSRPTAVLVEVPRVVTLTTALTVTELATKMSVSETEIIKRLFMKGIMRTVNQLVELELARELALEMEYEVLTEEPPDVEPEVEEEALTEADQLALVQRPPVVTIMGHVDHGKTSLLDAIRQTKFLLTDAEAGGITQHIGAYHVEIPHEDGSMRQIVFLDTPGHEAFTAMRARGAKATDIAILVVAADDGVMPQTVEAIDHAKAAGVPIIVAVNKIDKADADPDRVVRQLMEHGLIPDKYGYHGDTVYVNVSAKKRTGLDELLEMILLVADMLELKANPDKPAVGVIIEAELSRGKGPVATALIENGTLREGNFIVAGSASGRVRALYDDREQRVKAAGPSMPVQVLGLDEVPQAGDRFEIVEDINALKLLVDKHKEQAPDRRPSHVTLESLHDLLESGEVKGLNVIVKADVQGTAEAIAEQIKKLASNEVQVTVLRAASGGISENDVNLAASSNAIIVGFNAQPDQNATKVREAAGVDIRIYNVIYQITDDIEKAIQGLIEPLRQEILIGTAEIRQLFKFGKNLMIAGCMVTSGKIQRGAIARIVREGKVIYEGKIETLKRFKDDVREVAQGFECGMSFEKFADVLEGDIVNAYMIQETRREITRT